MVTITTGATELVETGEQRDVLGRRRTPKERRAQLLEAYRRSGMTQIAFAEAEGIKYTTFCCWAQAERRAGKLPMAVAGGKGRKGSPSPVRFVEARVPGPAVVSPAGLEVRLADGTVLRGGSASELAALVGALRG